MHGLASWGVDKHFLQPNNTKYEPIPSQNPQGKVCTSINPFNFRLIGLLATQPE